MIGWAWRHRQYAPRSKALQQAESAVSQAGPWIATFDGTPQVAFGGNMPVVAIRRLLDETEAASDSYTLLCNQDLAGTGVLYRSIIWNPPELLLPCGDCHGRGEYVGLLERETCGTCGGRKMVSV